MTMTKTVHVHAWEYVNVTLGYPTRKIDSGGVGFEFYPAIMQAEATAAFKTGIAKRLETSPHNVAEFLIAFDVPKAATTQAITKLLFDELTELCATAKTRRVGLNVLTYWKRNKFKMGTATRAAR